LEQAVRPARRCDLHVIELTLRDFRNYASAELSLSAGVTVIHGPVGAGKTNLLEALYFGCVGRSCRTSSDRELVRFGQRGAHVSVSSMISDVVRRFEVGLEFVGQRVLKVENGGDRLALPESRPTLCVFLPDRLELIKGAAGVRRAHLDTLVAALWPAREATRRSYARALAQRNALLSRVRAGSGSLSSLSGWNRELARHGLELMGARAAAVELLSASFGRHVGDLGLEGEATLRYHPRSTASTVEQLEAELSDISARDVERGFTTHGPHRDDLSFELDGRGLRRLGSQGQQRVALLGLLMAERDALDQVRGELPVLLLDDVLSELDRERRTRLLEALRAGGQTLITTADFDSVSSAGEGMTSVRVGAGRIDGREGA
jgi:DNA replication and repair protein RecF